MSEAAHTRKLAAILAADVAAYSRLMGDEEAATVETLTRDRAIFTDQTSRHDRRPRRRHRQPASPV